MDKIKIKNYDINKINELIKIIEEENDIQKFYDELNKIITK
jgi:Asp-tRNA(Asn)/Glu-tRNA(Gln) amidotransferase C subunit